MQLKNLSDGVVLRLPNDLLWSDEHAWSPAVSSVSYLLNGALLVQSAVRQAGRPITLVGAPDVAWVTRAVVGALQVWAAAPLETLDGANLKQLLGGESNMPVTEMRQRVSFVKFSREAADAAGVKPGTRGVLLESAALAGREPLYYLESFIPPNDRRLDVSAS